MPFNDGAQLDPSQVEDRRGRGGTGMVVGGGLGLVVMLVALFLGINPSDLGPLTQPSSNSGATGTEATQQCQTGSDANTREDCRIVGYVNSIQEFWKDEFAREGSQYSPAKLVLFTGSTSAACGYASSAMGPFYCPTDQQIYMDLAFFKELETRFGAKGGSFAQAYVVAHEYGHHIQNLTGALNSSRGDTGPNSDAVMIELQADCLAGVWAHNAAATGYISEVTDAEIAQSLDAAAAVGDDRIQEASQGYVAPESWTHGSSDQRQAALKDGLQSGDVATCQTPGYN
ncbi:MAG TPA: neutral zinc metallopeptidase [Herpetosiphonaceae bacterium]